MSVEPPARTNSAYIGDEHWNWFGERQCPSGSYVNKFYGRAGGMVEQVCAGCSDGTDLGCSYSSGAGNPFEIQSTNGWNSLEGRAGGDVDQFMYQGGGGGNPKTITCPVGTRVVGYGGTRNLNAGYLHGIYAKCGVVAEDYCQDNLESKFCQDSKVDARTLNIACGKNLTDTCRDRRQELTTSTVQKICRLNPDDPFCACFRPRPDYIPPELSGNQQCWNTDCASYGYIPNPDFVCPNITICREDIKTSGNSNILTGNVQVSTCGSNAAVVNTSDPTKVTSNPTNTVVPTTDTASSVTNWLSSNWLLIFIVLVVLAVIYGAISYFKNKNNNQHDSS